MLPQSRKARRTASSQSIVPPLNTTKSETVTQCEFARSATCNRRFVSLQMRMVAESSPRSIFNVLIRNSCARLFTRTAGFVRPRSLLKLSCDPDAFGREKPSAGIATILIWPDGMQIILRSSSPKDPMRCACSATRNTERIPKAIRTIAWHRMGADAGHATCPAS